MQYPQGFGVTQAMLCKDCFSCRTCSAVKGACAALALVKANSTDPSSEREINLFIVSPTGSTRELLTKTVVYARYSCPPKVMAPPSPIGRGVSSQLFPPWGQPLDLFRPWLFSSATASAYT